MEPKTIGIIFIGQTGGRAIEEVTSMLDASIEPVAGQPASRIASGMLGGATMVLPVFMKNMNPELQLALGVAGSHALVDAVADGVKEAMMGLGMGMGAAPGGDIPPGMGMKGMPGMQVINGSLVD